MIYAKNITDLNNIKSILDNIRGSIVVYESIYGDVPQEVVENIIFQLCEIEEFIIGPQKYTTTNIICSDLRMMAYWEYIEGNISFFDMLKEMKKDEGDI